MKRWMQRMRLRFLIGSVKGLEDMRAEYPKEVEHIYNLMWEAHQKPLQARREAIMNMPVPGADSPPSYEEDEDGNHIHLPEQIETDRYGAYCNACYAALGPQSAS